jgi:hypothetical protein
VACSSAAEAFVYLIKYDYDHDRYQDSGTRPLTTVYGVTNWTDYMDYVQRQVILSPEFSLWDKHTSEIEILAREALSVSQKVLFAHNAPDKRLPKELVDGIYTRIKVLKRWKVEYLDPIRARDDYKEWKIKQTTPTTQQSHCKLRAMWECVNGANVSSVRRRRNHLLSTTTSESRDVPNPLGQSDSRPSLLQAFLAKFNASHAPTTPCTL